MAAPRSRSLAKIRPQNQEVKDLQEAVADELRTIPRFFWTQMSILDVEFSGTAPQNLAHKLSGPHQGWLVIGITSSASRTIWEDEAGPGAAISDTHIRLAATGTCTAKIMVWR